jgi:hypothetical protein
MKSEVEDWLSELPPLDGAEDEPAAEDGLPDDLLPGADEADSLDDAAADDLEVDDGVDDADGVTLDGEEDDRWEADVGEPELDLIADSLGEGDGDAPGVGESEDDIDDDLPSSGDDAGEEGTTDAIEQMLDEELPALDADDEGDFEDALLLETGVAVATAEGPRWTSNAWERKPGEDRAVALVVPDDDAVARTAMCVAPETFVSVTVAGRLLFDGGSAQARGGRRLPPELTGGQAGAPLVALASSAEKPILWIAHRHGAIARSADLGGSWTKAFDLGKPVVAIAAQSDGSVVVLLDDAGAMQVATSPDGVAWSARHVDVGGQRLRVQADASQWLAAAGSAVAFGQAGGVWVSRRGEAFARVASLPATTAGAFVGPSPEAPLVFAEGGGDVDETARLFRSSPDAKVEILADVAPPDSEDANEVATIVALAWDERARVLRVAFARTVCSVGPRESA